MSKDELERWRMKSRLLHILRDLRIITYDEYMEYSLEGWEINE